MTTTMRTEAPGDTPMTGPVRLRPAVHVTTVTDGLSVTGWQTRMLVSGGPALHRLWSAMAPHLNTGVDVEALVAALPEVARPPARGLIARLSEADMLVPLRVTLAEDEAAPGVSSTSVERLLEFLDSAAGSPRQAWHTIRTATVAVVGAGAVAERVATLLLAHGVGTVAVTDPAVARVVAAAGQDADHGHLVTNDHGLGSRPDLVVAVDDVSTPPGVPAVRVLVLADRAIVLPATTDCRAGWLRRHLRRRGVEASPGPCPVTVAMLAAGQAAVSVLYALAGISTEQDGRAVSIHADRLRISHHPLWSDATMSFTEVRAGDRVLDDPSRLVDLSDPLTGLLPEALPQDWPQNPFAVAVTPRTTVLGTGLTGAAARYRAALESARGLIEEGPEPPRGRRAVTAAGADVAQFVVDALTRLLAGGLDSDLTREGVGPGLDDPAPAVTAARHRLRTAAPDARLTVRHARLSRDPDLLAVVTLTGPDGVLVALALGTDPTDALVRAADHAAARAQAGGRGEPVAQLGLASDLPEEVRPWTGDLDRLARAVTGRSVWQLDLRRVADGHALAELAVLGWLAPPEVTP